MRSALIAVCGAVAGIVVAYAVFWAWAWKTWSRDH